MTGTSGTTMSSSTTTTTPGATPGLTSGRLTHLQRCRYSPVSDR